MRHNYRFLSAFDARPTELATVVSQASPTAHTFASTGQSCILFLATVKLVACPDPVGMGRAAAFLLHLFTHAQKHDKISRFHRHQHVSVAKVSL